MLGTGVFASIEGSHSTTLTGTWERIELNVNGNYSKFILRLYFTYAGGTVTSSTYSSFYLDGELKKSGGYSYSTGEYLIGEKEVVVYHNVDGTYPGYSASISVNSYHFNTSASGGLPSDNISRGANFRNHHILSRTVNSITVYWASDQARDVTQYSINGKYWVGAGDTVSVDNKSGTYTIYNLEPNTRYTIRTRIRRTDNGIWTESDDISIVTYDKARFTSYESVLNIGETYKVKFANQANAKTEVGIYRLDGTTPIVEYRECNNNEYTFNFTHKESTELYKLCDTTNQYKARLYIKTTQNGKTYYEYKEITVKLTGKVNCVNINIGGVIKKGRVWVGTSTGNKVGVLFVGTSTGNRRGI